MTIYRKLALLLLLSSCNNTKSFNAEVYTVSKGDVSQKILFSGRIKAENSILIRAPIDSQLVKLYKTLGSKIKKGEVLATITEPKNNNRLNQIIEKEGDLKQTRLKMSQLKFKIKARKQEINQMSRLLASGSISKSEKDKAQIDYDIEMKELDILKSRELTLINSINLVKKTQKNSSRTLTSPIKGTITSLWAPEDKITVGISIPRDTIIAVIEEPGRYILKGDITEPDFVRMSIGQPVNINLAYLTQEPWQGTIKSLYTLGEKNNYGIGRFNVNAVFTSTHENIRSGLEGRAKITIQELKNQLRVPRSAVEKLDDLYFVSLPSKEGPKRHRIQVGLVGDEYIAVTSGLIAGNKIYTTYLQ